jgi:hypothetical protein
VRAYAQRIFQDGRELWQSPKTGSRRSISQSDPYFASNEKGAVFWSRLTNRINIEDFGARGGSRNTSGTENAQLIDSPYHQNQEKQWIHSVDVQKLYVADDLRL